MCVVTAYKSSSCPHRWMTITKFCGPNMGFTHTPHHEFAPSDTKFFSGAPAFEEAAANTCPNCDKRGQYDGNVTRMVAKKGGASACRVACGVGNSGPMQVGMVGGMVGGMGMYGAGYGGQQPYGLMPAYGYRHAYPIGGYQSGIMPGQILSPHQQQVEANRVAAEMRKRQFHPNQEVQESRCCVM